MKNIFYVLILSVFGSFAYVKLTSSPPKTPTAVPAEQSKGELYAQTIQSATIKNAFKDLVRVCPAVTNGLVEKISDSYEPDLRGQKGMEEATSAWQNQEYGWTAQVYFAVKSAPSKHRYSGHTHHFYVATEGDRGVIIDGKQESLDFCGIKATMKDHLLISIQ